MLNFFVSGGIGLVAGIFPCVLFMLFSPKKDKSYYKLNLWKKFVETQLQIFVTLVIIFLIILLFGGTYMKDILSQVGIGVLTGSISSIFLTILVYFNFLKRIPQETEKKIDDLLNVRLGYETTNHNTTMVALNPDNSHLSKEHTEIKNIIGMEYSNIKLEVKNVTDMSFAIKDHLVQSDYEKKLQYSNLEIKQKNIVDSIEKIYDVGNALQWVNNENTKLKGDLNYTKTQYKQLIEKYNNLVEQHNKLVNEYNQITKDQNYNERREQQKHYSEEVDFEM